MTFLNRKNWATLSLTGFVIALALVGPSISVIAQKPPASVAVSKITYPVAELGSCGSQQECEAYCGTASNYSKCTAFAQKAGLTVEVPDDKKGIFAAMQKGESPGQCKDEVSCRKYCEDIDHLEECINFVGKLSLASPDELKEMRQMAAVKQSGAKFPGNCKTKESCLTYCENSAHAVECMEFAQKAGFIKEDVEAVSKILPYLKSGGKFPGGCASRESCDAYCESDAHTNECVDFAVGAGFMTKEDAEIVRKTGSLKGPGNCKSKAGCEAFCVLPENQKTCLNWAKEHGVDHGGDECVKQGGNWDGKQCNFSTKGGGVLNADECTKQGGIWYGTGCDFSQKKGAGVLDATECTKQGGAWNGTQCDFSKKGAGILDAGECAKQGGNWNGTQCDFSTKGAGALNATECTKQGGAWNGTLCDFSMKGAGILDAGECIKQGGAWNGTQCDFSKKGGALDVTECAKQGGIWDGKQCDFSKKGGGINNAGECTKQGGSWNGTQCSNFSKKGAGGPPTDPDECAKQGGSWDGKQCKFFGAGYGIQDAGECNKQGGIWDGKLCDTSKKGVKVGGDQSQIPQGYSSWEGFCKVNIGDSRCAAYKLQTPFDPILNFFLGR